MSRRRFVQSLAATTAGLAGISSLTGAQPAMPLAVPGAPHAPLQPAGGGDFLPSYARAQRYRSRKQSSHDATGGNQDYWAIKGGEVKEIFNAAGAGCITHIWFTIAASSPLHLKELVLRAWWDGQAQPSIEVPVGDFFALNLGDYVIFESQYLACSPGQSLNAYFAMPYRKGARLTITNEGTREVGAFYSNIDYIEADSLPTDALYFHAQYRQATPNPAQQLADRKNPDGATNYVLCDTRGRGHLMGCSLGVIQRSEGWMGEGDDMITIDDKATPTIIGTGSEDYFLGSWNFGGRMNAKPFSHHQYGAHLIQSPERVGGRYDMYRFHGDNPVTFTRSLRYTIEHGHANDRSDHYYSCAYWYQDQPATGFPALPPVGARLPSIA